MHHRSKLTIQHSLLIITMIFLNSCVVNPFKGVKFDSCDTITTDEKVISFPSILAKGDSIRLFDLRIKFKEQKFSGLAVIKRSEKMANQYQISGTSKMGGKLFDLKFHKDKMEVGFIIEPLNKKMLLKLLESDFKMLLSDFKMPEKLKCSQKGEQEIFRFKHNRSKYYYNREIESKQTNKIFKKAGYFGQTCLEFKKYDNSFPKQIIFDHTGINLSLELNYLKSLDK